MKMSIQDKRTLLDSFAGRFYSVGFTKASGEFRQAQCQHLQHALFKDGHASKAHANPVAGKEHLYTMVDVQNQKWINCNLNTLQYVKCGDTEINFDN